MGESSFTGSGRRARWRRCMAAVLLILTVTPLAGSTAAESSDRNDRSSEGSDGSDGSGGHGKPFFDSRLSRPGVGPSSRAARAQVELAASLGPQGIVQVHPFTGTPRIVARLDGFLTPPSDRAPTAIAFDYVRDHLDAFGLTARDLAGVRLVKDYTDIAGTHHLVWAQTHRGVPAFDNDLRANITADGRLVNVIGSMVPGFSTRSTDPRLTEDEAIAAARREAGGSPERRKGDRATLVIFGTQSGAHLAYEVAAEVSSEELYASVVDAETGDVLWRSNMVNDATATGSAFDYYPGAPTGGTQATITLGPVDDGTRLKGNNTHTFADVNDNNVVNPGEEVPATSGTQWSYPITFFPGVVGGNCPAIGCTWNHTTANSWSINRNQVATQVFYYVNRFHDHLLAAPIGFTEAAGNFQQVNGSGQGVAGDPVIAHVDDGANGPGGLPNGAHANNANMATPPDGFAPRMQMYLFSPTFSPTGARAVNGGDDATIVYHEYAHGLSNRLVTTATGVGALGTSQSGAMGEAWSDWYALDFLVAQGFAPDTPSARDVKIGTYPLTDPNGVRFQALDCLVGDGAADCPDPGGGAGPGGFTYGDFGQVFGGPEVHADGEIWVQTLWQLRAALGSAVTKGLVTRAMELSPPFPSFLDMRNAILQADTVANAGANATTIWQVFAERGMGYFADTLDGNDTAPVEDFSTPPTCPPCGTVTGVITDADSGDPVAGATVALVPSAPNAALAATTNELGRYTIPNVPNRTYPRPVLSKPAYVKVLAGAVTVSTPTTTFNGAIRRDWAALDGGATIFSFDPPDYTSFGCGPNQGFDLSFTTGWGSDVPGPRRIVVALPQRVGVTQFAIDPGAVCGDPDSASVVNFTIETSPDSGAGPWTTAFTQVGALTPHVLTTLTPVGGTAQVRFVRLTMQTNAGHPAFMDMTELVVYGVPALAPQALAVDTGGNTVFEPGETVAVQPSWRNRGGSATTVTGALSSFVGPAATYSITDASGDYGTINNEATGSCTATANCYVLGINVPPSRPALHWDATVVETLAPAVTGTTKTWKLHVGDSFTDVPPSNIFYRFIETLLHRGVTTGCALNSYCPASNVTRQQMAIFLLRSKEGGDFVPPACVVPPFDDVPTSSGFCPWINELFRRGITTGCAASPPRYCPTDPVTRQQMAVFLLRTQDGSGFSPPACVAGQEVFDDVPASSFFCPFIEELFDRGITTGCALSPSRYCPNNPVTRQQMAAFLGRTFGLTLYGP